MADRILFVCLGNICRSPSAEAVLRRLAELRGRDLTIDSAGTGDWHVGEPPYGPMQKAARARGYDLSDQRARQVSASDFDRFDLILAMDGDNFDHLQRLRPDGSGAELRLFAGYANGADEVPDPYFTRDFDGCLDLIETAASGLLDRL